MTKRGLSTRELIDRLVQTMGCSDAPAAIRSMAKGLVARYVQEFGEPEIPISVEVLASLCGISLSDEAPVHSPDAELVPDGRGGMTMRVSADRPETRQRFSMAHEISHTFFPNYQMKVWCRPDARYRNRQSAEDELETLCDIGASELLFPQPWFGREAAAVRNAADLVRLASMFHASREATLRRYAETSAESMAVVYFGWKLKPTQKRTIGNRDQRNLFGGSPDDARREALKLRIEYTVQSDAFRGDGHYLPKDKSVESDGPIYRAAASGEPVDDECRLDLGQASGTYRVSAVPLWTAEADLGAAGECSVAAVLRPIAVRRPARKRREQDGPGLFDEA